MTKLIICVKSCQRDKDLGFHDVIRSTWGKDAKALGIDVKFFQGKNFSKYESDEVHLNCPDDYDNLPFKTREICKWVSGKLVDYAFLCDTDTFLTMSPMMAWFEKISFGRYDYAGKIDRDPKVPFPYEANSRERYLKMDACYPWASGGYGCFLSRKALTEVAYAYPDTWAEDLWVAQVLGPKFAAGEMTVLSTPANVYSFHHPKHGEIYDLETYKAWFDQMYRDHK